MKAAIFGAGIMGSLLAFELVNTGWQVSLFDKDNKNGLESASMAAAGLLAPISELEKSDLILFDLGMEALNLHWPRILNHLGNEIYFSRAGSLLLAHPRDKKEMCRFIDTVTTKLNDHKKIVALSQKEISTYEPELTKFDAGYYFTDEAQLDNQTLLQAIRRYLNKNNVQWQKNIVIDDIDHEQFDVVFDCRGLGAKSFFKDLRGVRGEIIWLHAPEVTINRPVRLIHPRYNLYIAPRPQHIYILGASEIESEAMNDISVRTVLELLSAAFYLHSGFAEARMIKTIVQCRPTLLDHLPQIKLVDKKFIAINGLYRHGFLIAPTLASEILRWLHQGIAAVHYPRLWQTC